MLPKIFQTIYADALENPTVERDAFTSDWALSTEWVAENPEELLEKVDISITAEIAGKIYDLAHGSVMMLAAQRGISNRMFAGMFGIPSRTAEDWAAGKRTPPDWVKLLLAESTGYLDPGVDWMKE